MRSYYEHLASLLSPTESPKTHRSSALFPVVQTAEVTTRIIFLGYWLLKRAIDKVECRVTLRAETGELLLTKTMMITEAKAYNVELRPLLNESDYDKKLPFIGSLEIEFFSDTNLVFPYPAVAINIYGTNCSTVVHVAERVFNNDEDAQNNDKIIVPEAGFNIYADEEREPFIALVNGPAAVGGATAELTFINHANEQKEEELLLGDLFPYETRILYPAREFHLAPFLQGRAGTMKVSCRLAGVFPRLLVGNVHEKLHAFSITHSYYDCSQQKEKKNYWLPKKEGWHLASLLLPARISHPWFTHIYFYPIYSPASFAIDLEIYNSSGTLLGAKEEIISINKNSPSYQHIALEEVCEELEIAGSEPLVARLIARTSEKTIPARIKAALDIGSDPLTLPCNICTNFIPYNPEWENKKQNFRWVPLLADQPHWATWILNGTTATASSEPSEFTLTIYRARDTETLTRSFSLPPHGFALLSPEKDPELQKFLGGAVGWATIKSTNPYCSTFYFSENSSTVVGGDHGF